MNNVNCGFFGTKETFKMLGTGAAESDLAFNHYTKGDMVLTTIMPLNNKIQTITAVIHLSDIVVIEVAAISKELGELIIGTKLLERKGLLLVKNDPLLLDQVNKLNTGFEIIHYSSTQDLVTLKERLMTEKPKILDKTMVEIDTYFNVKGVGLVVLGFVTGGEIKARMQYSLYPNKRLVNIKSIQCMDVDYKVLNAKNRVGLALANCTPEDLVRGSIITDSTLEESDIISGTFSKAEYFKDEIKTGMNIMIANGLRIINGEITSLNPFTVKLGKKTVFPEDKTLILYPESKGLRLVGVIKK
ncbi:Uncharacterised protein [Candidatus Tiddalikarchaeum anstoanum]|nr:Uncharacterised protein [Candidatus Tiddalikarchaeum anstoanum]